MLLPSGENSRILAMKSGNSVFARRKSASLALASAGLTDTAPLSPTSRLSRLPIWSSTCAANSRASLDARSMAAAWSLRH